MNSALGSPTSLLFTDTTEVGIPVAKFTKITPVSNNHANLVTQLQTSTVHIQYWSRQLVHRLWTVPKKNQSWQPVCRLLNLLYGPQKMLKLTNQMSTMNSACTVLKSAFGSPTFILLLYDNSSFEVGIPIVDSSLSFCPTPSSLLKLTSDEVSVWSADFPLHSPGMSSSG